MLSSLLSTRSWGSAALALVLALWIHGWNHFASRDTYFPPVEVDEDVESHFSHTYYEARALFRERAQAAGTTLHAIPLEHLRHLDLTIDVAVLRGSSEKALLHISGTHGVEGFAGSGIQCALLARLANVASGSYPADSPTLIFVHVLNPFGMAMLRRFNEHNVDLNRNFLKPEDFQRRRDADPNAYGYVDLKETLNPRAPTQRFAWLRVYAQLVQTMWKHGGTYVKRAIVAGNYRFPKTIFFGGETQEPSGRLLFQFVKEQLDLDKLRLFGLIDVHTGLGPPGYDTLMMKSAKDLAVSRGVFKNRTPIVSGDSSDDATKGYEGSEGYVATGFDWFLPDHVTMISLTQEFGTAPGPFVLNAMIKENAMYHHAPSRRLPYAEQLRDVFYLHRSVQWKSDVVSRGITVWGELEAHLDAASSTS